MTKVVLHDRVYSTYEKTDGAVNRLFAAVFGWSVVGRARGSKSCNGLCFSRFFFTTLAIVSIKKIFLHESGLKNTIIHLWNFQQEFWVSVKILSYAEIVHLRKR